MNLRKNGLKINFRLQELDKIVPWGAEPHLSLHWFGLTDGLLWIDVGEDIIYEYNEAARQEWGDSTFIKYNDYQLSRFLEDFFGTFKYVGESIPKELYNILEEFDLKTESWKECYIEEEDELFDQFYFEEYCELNQWYSDRSFDSGHLIGGPYIGCFRCEDKIKILWESTFELENGSSIWTAPKGCFEMFYDDFVEAVTDFFETFVVEMDKQVECAVKKDWGSIFLDKDCLIKENAKRKSVFGQCIAYLKDTPVCTDWRKIRALYLKMEAEINKVK